MTVEVERDQSAYSERFDRALILACIAHAGKVRKGTEIPYIAHPVHVASILMKRGLCEDVVVAGLLHDVMDDAPWADARFQHVLRSTFVELQEVASEPDEMRRGVLDLIRRSVGDVVHSLASLALSKKPEERCLDRPWLDGKLAQLDRLRHASRERLLVKAADLIHNLRSTTRDLKQAKLLVFERFNAPPQEQILYASRVVQTLRTGLGSGDPLAGELRDAFRVYCQVVGDLSVEAGDLDLLECAQAAHRRAVSSSLIILDRAEVAARLEAPLSEGRWYLAVEPNTLEARIVHTDPNGSVEGTAGHEDLFPLSMAVEGDGYIEGGDWTAVPSRGTLPHDGAYRGYLVRWT